MDFKRRKITVQEIKKDFGIGGAWKDDLRRMVVDICDVEIDMDIAGMIYDYSLGWWEDCVHCGDKIDGPSSKSQQYDIHKWDTVNYYCSNCEANVKDSSSEYPFNDD